MVGCPAISPNSQIYESSYMKLLNFKNIKTMNRKLKTKFYEFIQNNSGGYFDEDENVCYRVIIEATDAKHAQSLFEPMIENQSVSCPCCGDRWSSSYPDELEFPKWKKEGYPVSVYDYYKDAEQRWFSLYGEFPRIEEPTWQTISDSKIFTGKIYFETIEQYCQLMANNYGWTIPDARIHFLNGTKKEIFYWK